MKKPLKTLLFILVCAFSGNACSDILEAANTLYKEGNHEEALEIYLHPEFNHNAAVQNRIGTLYLLPALRDEKKSAEWFRKSAEQGNRYAQFNLGMAYRKGYGVQKDNAIAIQLFKQSAAQDYTPAMNVIARMYEEGSGVEKSEETAIHWYLKSANNGNTNAIHRLADIYEHSQFGQPANRKKAQQWKSRAKAQ